MDETPTIEEVLTAWSDASLAAELARRLAKAGDAAVGIEPEAAAAPEVEYLIESTVQEATEAAAIAKGTGDRLHAADGSVKRTAARGGKHEVKREAQPHGDGDKP